MFTSLKTWGALALVLALLASTAALTLRLHGAQLDAERAHSALAAQQAAQARENQQRSTTRAKPSEKANCTHAINRSYPMPTPNRIAPAPLLWLLPMLLASACASRPAPTPAPPVLTDKPTAAALPAAIAAIEPPPSGHYMKLLTNRRENSRKLLNSTPTPSAPSSKSLPTTGR